MTGYPPAMKRRFLIVLALSVVALLVLIAPLVAVGLVLPAIQQAREAARREETVENLRQIGIALHNYHASETRPAEPAGDVPSSEP